MGANNGCRPAAGTTPAATDASLWWVPTLIGTESTAPTKVGNYQNRLPASGRHYPCNSRCIALVGANLGWHEPAALIKVGI
ncbi:hypothetical protein [Stenotrophomonas sp. DR009]|uniref:hypothetical protein n=1 Tax=Stenotrophomonas sp. DR009 TaxID=3398461 RepID=UPI003BB21460